MMKKLSCAALVLLCLPIVALAQNPCDNAFPDSCQYPDTCCVIPRDQCPWDPSDLNGVDVVYMVNFFKGFGPPPRIFSPVDVNCNCRVNGVDIIYLINYLKGIGPAPICCFYICPHGTQTGAIGGNTLNDADSNGPTDSPNPLGEQQKTPDDSQPGSRSQ